ncbi:MAG: TetR/AcrR family transcriptional regulator [Acidimicrobiales bacterium]|nr:TetR/AcrR family transcriptional regulator [Acidimicrobiales bacterium]
MNAVLHPEELPAAQRERRDRIVRAALDLLADGEYESIQMRQVAEHADVALATLYRYFGSKEHLYAAVLVEWSAGYWPDAPADAGHHADVERLRTLLRRAVRSFERWPQMFRTQMVLEHSSDPQAQAMYERFARHHGHALAAALSNLDPLQAADIVTTLSAVLSDSLRSWARGRCTIAEVDRRLQRTVDLVFGPPPTWSADEMCDRDA